MTTTNQTKTNRGLIEDDLSNEATGRIRGNNYLSLVLSAATFMHYGDVIMGTIAYLITSLSIVYSTVYSDANQRKHQSSASLAFVLWTHRGPVNPPHKWPVTRKMFPFDDVVMCMYWQGTMARYNEIQKMLALDTRVSIWSTGITKKNAFVVLHLPT